VLDRAHPRGVKRGHLWTYVGDQGAVAFCDYTPDWKGDHPRAVLAAFGGRVAQGDGYAGLDADFARPGPPGAPAVWTTPGSVGGRERLELGGELAERGDAGGGLAGCGGYAAALTTLRRRPGHGRVRRSARTHEVTGYLSPADAPQAFSGD
jgi:hypothetical protein